MCFIFLYQDFSTEAYLHGSLRPGFVSVYRRLLETANLGLYFFSVLI